MGFESARQCGTGCPQLAEADLRLIRSEAGFDPNVWSGRALQEGFVNLADVRSCINVSGF